MAATKLRGATPAQKIEHISEYVESVTMTLLDVESGLGLPESERIAAKVAQALREAMVEAYDPDEMELAAGFNELVKES